MGEARKKLDPDDDALTVAQVVELFPYPRSTVYQHIKAGHWDDFISKVGKLYVSRRGLEEWTARGGTLACRTTLDVTKHRSTGTRGSRGRMGREATGKVREKRPSETLSELLNSGTPLKLLDIPSSRLSRRTSS